MRVPLDPACANASRASDTDAIALARVWTHTALPPGFDADHVVRAPAVVQKRQRMFGACLALHPHAGIADGKLATLDRAQGRPSRTRAIATFMTNRTLLAAHGASINARLAAFAEQYHLAPADWRATVGHAGPWVEDFWRATFQRPVRYRISAATALARDAALRAAAVDDGGSRYVLVECVAASQGTDDWRLIENHLARDECRSCEVALVSVAAVLAAAVPGAPLSCSALAGVTPEASAEPATWKPTFWNLFLELTYDAELFHPFVPLFVPWENVMAAAAARNTWAKIRGGEIQDG